MDELDYAILTELQEDGRRPFTEIAKNLGVAESTVRNRVARMLHEGLLRIRGYADPHRLGFETPAFVFITVQPGYLDRVAAAIAALPEVSYLVATMGNADLVAELQCRNANHLMEVITRDIHNVDGVTQTTSSLILHVYKEVMPDVNILRPAAGE